MPVVLLTTPPVTGQRVPGNALFPSDALLPGIVVGGPPGVDTLFPSDTLYPSDQLFPNGVIVAPPPPPPPPPPPGGLVSVQEYPPLRHSTEVVTPAGRYFRWALDEPDPTRVPSGIRHSDTMPGGFETYDAVLPRKSEIDYSDLEPLSTITITDAGGAVVGEYRLERAPRVSGDQMGVSPSAVGWQAALEDVKDARQIYVDRDLTRWGEPSSRRSINNLLQTPPFPPGGSTAIGPSGGSGLPALTMAIDGDIAVNQKPILEAVYDAGAGMKVAKIQYEWERVNATATVWVWNIAVADRDDLTGTNYLSGDLQNEPNATSLSTFTPTAPLRYAKLGFWWDSTVGNNEPAKKFVLYWRRLAVFGDHGLTTYDDGSGIGAVYASDVVADAVRRWAPFLQITNESVQPSSFLISHLVFVEPTTAGEIVRQATRFGLQDWAVWEDRTFYWQQRGDGGRNWRARTAATKLEETGPQIDRVWNSVLVQYQDVDGSTRTAGPVGSGADAEDAALTDSDPANPANEAGIQRRALLTMGITTATGAVEVGRRFLEEQKALDTSGRATITGFVEDDHGVLFPYSRVRAGDTITFIDANDPSPRRIVRTEKDHSARTCTVELDSPPEGLAALLERLGVGLTPLGL